MTTIENEDSETQVVDLLESGGRNSSNTIFNIQVYANEGVIEGMNKFSYISSVRKKKKIAISNPDRTRTDYLVQRCGISVNNAELLLRVLNRHDIESQYYSHETRITLRLHTSLPKIWITLGDLAVIPSAEKEVIIFKGNAEISKETPHTFSICSDKSYPQTDKYTLYCAEIGLLKCYMRLKKEATTLYVRQMRFRKKKKVAHLEEPDTIISLRIPRAISFRK